MTDDLVQAAIGDLAMAEAQQLLPPATIAALRLADLLTGESPAVTEKFQTQMRGALRRHSDPRTRVGFGRRLWLAALHRGLWHPTGLVELRDTESR